MKDGTDNVEVIDEAQAEAPAVDAVASDAVEVHGDADVAVVEAVEAVAEPVEPQAVIEPSAPSLAEELDALRAVFDSEKGKLVSDLNAARAKITHMEELAEEREALIAKMDGEAEAAKAAVEAIKTKLSNPAFNAAVEGEQEAAEVSGDADGCVSVLDQLMAINDPKEKTKFRRENAEAIKQAQRELAGK